MRRPGHRAAARRAKLRTAVCLLAATAALAAAAGAPAPAQAAQSTARTAKSTARAATRTPAPRATPRIPDSIPQILSSRDRQLYRQAFDAIDAGQVSRARALAREARSPLLRSHILAEAMLAERNPSFEEMRQWLEENLSHPLAARILERIEAVKPADARLPALPAQSVAEPAEPVTRAWDGPGLTPLQTLAANRLARRLQPLVNAMRLAEAERMLDAERARGSLAPHTHARWGHQIAWRYYIEGDDAGALRVGEAAGAPDTPEAGRALWAAGLAAWRQGEFDRAGQHFAAMGAKPGLSAEEMAAARFWEARAHLACQRPERVSPLLRQAAQVPESFYGLLALRLLGVDLPFNWGPPGFIQADWNQIRDIPAVQRAVALVRIGELGRADRELKHLWGQTDPGNYDALVRLASALGLPSTQKWLSLRPPEGQTPPMAIRFPAPDWEPHGGWRVDKALVFALALQESRFQTDAVSRAGARGVMQLMPGTVQAMRRQGMLNGVHGSLNDPVFNLEAGQTYLEHLRDWPANEGLLPRILASYNAGPTAVSRWKSHARYAIDPLLYIESIPYAQTRGYVERVLQYYWLYQLRFNMPTDSLDDLAQGRWPRFPRSLVPPPAGADEEAAAPVVAAAEAAPAAPEMAALSAPSDPASPH
ncbi:lytic transglycosylase domain-containing protein [Pedomonas sp. V897]|uniref:lytic transglycosylase domain-containing protein n=1 Tax=Pedomonas sp. V897 TaxID=3446482 RepID=UPI003EDECD8E